MLKVLIVDDEPLFRIAMREMIDWEALGCEIVSEASNGREGLRYIEKNNADIVLIDVQMPQLNGIQFLDKLKEMDIGLSPLVIMLSAYPAYPYVRQAFQLGAFDYLVKEDLAESYVTPIVKRAAAERVKQLEEMDYQRKETQQHQKRTKEDMLASLLRNDSIDDSSIQENTGGISDWLEGSYRSQQVFMCLLVDQSYSEESSNLDKKTARYIQVTVAQVVEAVYPDAVMISASHGEFALLLDNLHLNSFQQARNKFIETVNKIRSHLKQYMNISVSIGVSASSSGMKAWAENYSSAHQLALLRFYFGLGNVYFTGDLQMLETVVPDFNKNELLYRLEIGAADWEKEFDKLFDQLKSIGMVNVENMFHYYKTLIREVGILLYAKGFSWQDISGNEMSTYDRLEQFEYMPQVHEWFKLLFAKVHEVLDPARQTSLQAPKLVERARKFIERHHNDPISLTLVSQWVGVSESHLSKMFVKETGEKFIDYLTRVRMEKAVHMLSSGMKIYQIGEKVGYPNQAHFSTLFKRVTGKTPSEYKQDIDLNEQKQK